MLEPRFLSLITLLYLVVFKILLQSIYSRQVTLDIYRIFTKKELVHQIGHWKEMCERVSAPVLLFRFGTPPSLFFLSLSPHLLIFFFSFSFFFFSFSPPLSTFFSLFLSLWVARHICRNVFSQALHAPNLNAIRATNFTQLFL